MAETSFHNYKWAMKEEKKVNTLGTCRWIRLSLMQISLLTYTQTHLHFFQRNYI